VIVGFNADQVEDTLARRPVAGIETRTVYNPFYQLSDNLATAWLARGEMQGDFLMLNGDTLFAPDALELLLSSPKAPLTLAINQKEKYDDDDMKVSLDDDGRLLAVGKTLSPDVVHGESIGLMQFRGEGPRVFRQALEAAIREPEALGLWYLSVVNGLVDSLEVQTAAINGLWWAEIDCAEDLALVQETLAKGGIGSKSKRLAKSNTRASSRSPRHAE
jgi:choline kinase